MVDGLDRILPALLPLVVVLILGTSALVAVEALRLVPCAVSPSGDVVDAARTERGAAGLSCVAVQRREWQDSGGLLEAVSLDRTGARCIPPRAAGRRSGSEFERRIGVFVFHGERWGKRSCGVFRANAPEGRLAAAQSSFVSPAALS